MAWVSPTGHSDPDSGWTDETKAYDGNLATFAVSPGNQSDKYLVLTRSVLLCDKVRIFACWDEEGDEVDAENCCVDVYYSGAWHNIFGGQYGETITANVWTEMEIGSTQTVTQARVKSGGRPTVIDFRVKEFEFNEVAAAAARPLVGGSLAGGRKGLI